MICCVGVTEGMDGVDVSVSVGGGMSGFDLLDKTKICICSTSCKFIVI